LAACGVAFGLPWAVTPSSEPDVYPGRLVTRSPCHLLAAATLADIAAGRTDRCILCWIPLMRADDRSAIIAEWKRLAAQEPDEGLRGVYAALALVFAELSPGLVEWQKGLEGWEMKESQYIKGWLSEGEAKGELKKAQEALLTVLEARFPQEPLDQLRLAIQGTNDLDILQRWFDEALTATTVEAFRKAMPPNGAG
jgi:hypothetical protein